MYYITNQNGQVIAASSGLLELLEAENIDALYRQIALDTIEFAAENGGVTLKTPLEETHYRTEEEELSSLVGSMTLVRLIAEPAALSEEEAPVLSEKEEETAQEEETFSLLDDDELFSVKEEKTEIPAAEEKPAEEETQPLQEEAEEEDDLFDLILPGNAEETIGQIGETQSGEKAPVYIDVEQIAESIGVSEEDYNTFLTEYIDTALSLEEDLRSDDAGKRTAAIHTLFHLSNVLRLPVITEIIEQMKYTEAEDMESSIESFYDTLSRLTTSRPETEMPETKIAVERDAGAADEKFESFGTIDLSDVKPIHFDFQVDEAASELSLPAELIEEFIQDFIKQAHEETDKMLEAYEKGDLETIQKIGHLLKGTAANLRINPLSDTLYEIQFCDDPSRLEGLIREYWAHFISFEKQFNLKSQK